MADEKTTTTEPVVKESGEETNEIIQIIASILKTAPTDTRKTLGKIIRTDPDIWNSINGVGNVEESVPKGGLKGLVRSGNTLLSGATVTAQQNGVDITSVLTDANGSYRIELEVGSYDFVFSQKDYKTELKNDEPVFSGIELTTNVELIKEVV